MKRLWLIPVVLVALLIPVRVLAGGGGQGFDGVVNAIEARYHVHTTRVPFLASSTWSRARPHMKA